MMKQLYKIIWLGVYALLPLSLLAQFEFAPGVDANNYVNQITIPKVSQAPVIDGMVDPVWDNASWNTFQYWELETNANNNPTLSTLPPTSDFSFEWKAIWDTNTVYFLIHVTDDITSYSPTRASWWRQDGVEFYIRHDGEGVSGVNRNDTASIAWFNIYPNPDASNAAVLSGNFQTGQQYGVLAKVSVSGSDVYYEIQDIPWTDAESRGAVPSVGDSLRVAMMFNEGDSQDTAVDSRDLKATWSVPGEARLFLTDGMGVVKLGLAVSNEATINRQPLRVFPNPAHTEVSLQYYLPQQEEVEISLLDVQGRSVIHQSIHSQAAGMHVVPLGLAQLASGVYTIQIHTASWTQHKRLLVQP